MFEFIQDRDRRAICGCPECCARLGYTAIYTMEDFKPGVEPLEWWAKALCKEKLGLLVRDRIVPGWPGAGAK